MQFRVIVVTDPQTHTQTHRQPTGPITIQCAAKLSAQCKYSKLTGAAVYAYASAVAVVGDRTGVDDDVVAQVLQKHAML